MYIVILILLILLIILLFFIWKQNNNNQNSIKNLIPIKFNYNLMNKNQNQNQNVFDKCQVGTLNTEQCYKSKFFECPIVNGSYLQCTNNYIPEPKIYNAPCENRTFEMTPYPFKLSENCYYNNTGFNRNKFKLELD